MRGRCFLHCILFCVALILSRHVSLLTIKGNLEGKLMKGSFETVRYNLVLDSIKGYHFVGYGNIVISSF